MDAFINYFRGLSRNAQTAIIIALMVSTPVVGIVIGMIAGGIGAIFTLIGFMLGIVFSGIGAAFTLIGFVFGFVKWSVAIPLLLGVAAYKGYRFIQDNGSMDEDEEEEDFSWDPFR